MEIGDTFTMWETPRLPWWGRLAVRLGLRAKPKPELRAYKVMEPVPARPWQDFHAS